MKPYIQAAMFVLMSSLILAAGGLGMAIFDGHWGAVLLLGLYLLIALTVLIGTVEKYNL